MSSAQGARNSSFSHFFPTAAKRKAAKERQKSTSEVAAVASHPATPLPEDETTPASSNLLNDTGRQSNPHTSIPPDQHDKLSPPQDPGDLLNDVGSASSLASTSSSIFSTVAGTKSGQSCAEATFNSLTPLTNHESSPPHLALSPKLKSRPLPISQTQINESSKPAAMSASSMAADTLAVRVAKALPGSGQPRGMKIVYDPDLDATLAIKDRRKAKPRYEPLAEEV